MKQFIALMIVLILVSPAYGWEWIKADELKPGDRLMDKDGNEVVVETIEKIDGAAYYLETGKDNYFADGVLVKSTKEGNEIGKGSGNEITGEMVRVTV